MQWISKITPLLILLCLICISVLSLTFQGCEYSSESSSSTKTPTSTDAILGDGYIPLEAKSVLWVGAHPDDEVYVAPLLAELCIHRKLKCHLLVMTDGGKGKCLLPSGCQPSVAAVRNREMINTATYYNAILEKQNFEDGPADTPEGVLAKWNDSIGGGTKLMDAITNFIKNLKPDIILSFDPRHGSSCHLDHRAVGSLVWSATLQAGFPLSSLYVPQSYVKTGVLATTQPWAGNDIIIPSDQSVRTLDASTHWSSLIKNLSLHPSQFGSNSEEFITSFLHTPKEFKILPLLRAQDIDLADARYQNLCPENDARWPGR